MRALRLAFVAPIALLAACTGNPQYQQTSPLVVREPVKTAARPVPNKNQVLDEPAQLKGLTPTQVASVLGKPGFTRRDAPAEIWSYRGMACTLDVFLYDDGAQRQTVAHYAVRSPKPVSDADCLRDLVGRTGQIPTS